MDWFSLLSTVLSAGTSIFNNIFNADQTNKTNQANRDYADAMTTAQWERDDSSFQRQVADAKAAGLSPLAVTGYSPSSSPVTAMAQAPQMDFSSLIGALMQMPSNELGRDTLEQGDRHHAEDLSFQISSAQIELQKFRDDLAQRQVEHKDEVLEFCDTLDYQYAVLNETISSDKGNLSSQNVDRLLKIQESSLEDYKNICSVFGLPPKTKYYTDFDAYVSALNSWTPLLENLSGKSDVSSSSSSSSGSTSYGGAMSINLPTVSSSSGSSVTEDFTRSNTVGVMPSEPFPLFKVSPDKVSASRGNSSLGRKSHDWNY